MRRVIFLGYDQHAGGGWSGDLLVADWEEVASAQSFSEIHIKRFKQKEITPTLAGESFKFPVAEGSLRQPGADHLDSGHPDPFDRAGGNSTPSSNDDEGDDHWKELDPFDIEDESQQKVDPDNPDKEEVADPTEPYF